MHHWKVHQNTFDVKPFIWWIEIKWGSYSICQVHQESSWAAYQEWCLAFSFSLKLKHASLKGAPEYIWCEYLECQIVKVQPNTQPRWADFLIEELTHAQAQTQANTKVPEESIILFSILSFNELWHNYAKPVHCTIHLTVHLSPNWENHCNLVSLVLIAINDYLSHR